MTNTFDTSANRRNRVLHLGLHHFNPPSLNGKVTKKRKYWEKQHCVLEMEKGSSITSEATMDYSFLTLNFLLLQCIQEAQYIALQRGNGGLIPTLVKAYGSTRVKISGNL